MSKIDTNLRPLTIREALKGLGYREARPGKWTKPVGFVLFTYDESTEEWTNWFLGAQSDEPLVWEIKKPNHDPEYAACYIDQIKSWEAWTRIDFWCSARAHFHGPTIDI